MEVKQFGFMENCFQMLGSCIPKIGHPLGLVLRLATTWGGLAMLGQSGILKANNAYQLEAALRSQLSPHSDHKPMETVLAMQIQPSNSLPWRPSPIIL